MSKPNWRAGRTLLHLAAIGTYAVLLTACGGLGRSDRPAQVEERAPEVRAPAPESGAQLAAYRPPAPPRVARPVPNRAVGVLMRRADDQRRAGDLDAATVSLERALRIAPDDAVLWHRLAAVRMAQQRHDLVVQLAAKSNALAAAGDDQLRGDNWRLIAQARRALGDAAGARDAEQRAAALR
jgi:tetratricopeptide (TPR) repeat protein